MSKASKIVEKYKVAEASRTLRSINDVPNARKNIKKLRDDVSATLSLANELRRSFGNIEEEDFLKSITQVAQALESQVSKFSPMLNELLRNKFLK